MTKYVAILVTASSKKEAEKITNVLLKEKSVACVNIIPEVISKYWWNNKIEKSKESMLVIKTRNKFVNNVIKLVKKTHSYTVPEVIALPILSGNKAYLNWIEDVTSDRKN